MSTTLDGGGAVVQPTRAGLRRSLTRVLAMALLPASMLPVLLAGPALLRAPRTLWRQAWADVQRMQASTHTHKPSTR